MHMIPTLFTPLYYLLLFIYFVEQPGKLKPWYSAWAVWSQSRVHYYIRVLQSWYCTYCIGHSKCNTRSVSLSFTRRPRSASLPLLLSDGENPSSGTSPPKQFSSWNKRPHPPTPHPLYSRPHPIREWESCESSSYCITAKGNDANPDNFYHHGWEKLGLTISETLLLKYREW